MTPQKCENCNGEFKTNIKKFDSSIIGCQFYLCVFCLNSIIRKHLREKSELENEPL